MAYESSPNIGDANVAACGNVYPFLTLICCCLLPDLILGEIPLSFWRIRMAQRFNFFLHEAHISLYDAKRR